MGGSGGSSRGNDDMWLGAAIRAAVMLVVSVVVFALVPERLLTFLAIRVSPSVRDVLVVLWWVVALVATLVLFVRLQPRRTRRTP
jgi:hypothetical protein